MILKRLKNRNFWWVTISWPIKCVSLNDHPCQARLTLVNINSNETFSYPFTVIVKKCGGSCYAIDDPYASVYISKKVKSMNVKLFDLMLGVNQIKFLVQYESCAWKCKLNESVCNSK